MANRLGISIVLSILGVSCGLTACGDDPASDAANGGGAGGEAPSGTAGTKTGGSTSGGAINKAGSGGGGSGGVAVQGGAAGDNGAAGAGGDAASLGGAAGAAAGAAGDGGAAGLVYLCGDQDISHKACSALGATSCPDVISCSDCLAEKQSTRADFLGCASCLAAFDRYFQCGIDAFESGQPANGIECAPGYGPDFTVNCYAFLDSALACNQYLLGEPGPPPVPNACPAVWPLP